MARGPGQEEMGPGGGGRSPGDLRPDRLALGPVFVGAGPGVGKDGLHGDGLAGGGGQRRSGEGGADVGPAGGNQGAAGVGQREFPTVEAGHGCLVRVVVLAAGGDGPSARPEGVFDGGGVAAGDGAAGGPCAFDHVNAHAVGRLDGPCQIVLDADAEPDVIHGEVVFQVKVPLQGSDGDLP